MKTLEKRIAGHARAHLAALKNRRHETQLSEAQAQQIISRTESVLDQLAAAVKQAHERVIGGRRVANEDKIPSLYDDSVKVIKRGKAGAAVEFGPFRNGFLGRPLLAKGFKHREVAVGWAALTHNLWVVVRMAEAEKKRKEAQEQ